MRIWLFRALIIGFAWVVVSRFAEIERLAETLTHGQWQWILAALALQVVYYSVYTGLYQSAFSTVGVKSRWRELWPVTLGSLLVNVVAPSGGASGAAVFVDDAARRGESGARAAAGTLLVMVSELGTFVFILVVGMVYLFRQHELKPYEVAGAGVLIAVIIGLAATLLAGLWRPTWIRKLLDWMRFLLGKATGLVRRPNPLGDHWADATASEFSEAAAAIRERPALLGRTALVAICAHVIDLACLYVIFLAFHQSIGFGGLVAGYSMAILFWIVSPTPQGVGVVEAVVAMTFASLGVPANKAIIIALTFRGLSFWLPLAIGLAVLRRAGSFRFEERVRATMIEVRVLAVLVAVAGVINVLSAATPSLSNRLVLLDPLIPTAARHGARLVAVLAGFGLILLSKGLWRHKRVAWMIALLLLSVSLVSHLLKGLDYEEAAVAAALAVWLLALRSHYHSMSDPPSVKQGIWLLFGSAVFSILYGTVGFYLLDKHFAVNYGFWDALRQTWVMFFDLYDPGLEPTSGFGRYFAGSIYIVGAATLGCSLLLLLKPVFLRNPATPEERDRARRIVERYGMSSLAAMALLPDKSYFFSKGGSVIAFASRAGIGLALGDPIGPKSDRLSAIREFSDYCLAHDWRPAFYQTLPDDLQLFQSQGLQSICIGHEAIVRLADFSLEGGAAKTIRTSINRLTRLGYKAVVHDPPISPTLLDELRMVSDEWLTTMHGSEKRFSLGWFDDDYISGCTVMTIRSEDGAVVAFANVVSEYARNESTIDLMRRTNNAPSGVMDFLFVSLFEWAKSQGFDTFNLGLAPLSGVGDKSDDAAVEKALSFVYEHANLFYGFKGLRRFKEKFAPKWEPRYLVYDGLAFLLSTAYAIVSADSGKGLVSSYLFRRHPSSSGRSPRKPESI